jgi:hypothetical protein
MTCCRVADRHAARQHQSGHDQKAAADAEEPRRQAGAEADAEQEGCRG